MGVSNFCGLIGTEPTSVQGKNLIDLEWDGNEININRWETIAGGAEKTSRILNVYGQQGWELVCRTECTYHLSI